ncbi:PilN domain-containing protein [Neogemmobacter tilapiae]|uniref:PilN domain-containing protein n=1 Tax=Neogemmobacter tilapiae TaxID=875041 RepID=A0A918TZ60_9RHOB|nr:PilN domain-containing protein [Gemmobacter tilapiae]GHC65497.1 hypothetical protein GCM10007315_32640 [Gemmobacter tilapiae]
MRSAFLNRIDPAGRFAQFFERLFPHDLFLPGFFRIKASPFRVEALPLNEAGRIALGDLVRKADEIELEIDASAALLRTIRLPKAAAAAAEEAVRMQLRQTLPGQAQGLVWQISTGRVEGDFLTYQVRILRQEDIDALRRFVAEGGTKVTAVRLAGQQGRPFWSEDEKQSKRARTAAMGAVLAVLVIALVPIWQLSVESRALADANAAKVTSIEALEAKLRELSTLADGADTREADLANDVERFIRDSRKLSLLTDLAQRLPPNVWLSEMSVSGREMRLSGFSSGDAPEALRVLQASPWVEVARMDGPIQIDSLSRQNRFNISIQLKDSLE